MNASRLSEMLTEVVILALGLLLMIMALAGRFNLPASLLFWLGLGVVSIIWGGRTWLRSGRFARPGSRAMLRVRGASMVLAGAVMVAMAWVPFGLAPRMLALVGGILALRGAVGAALAGGRALQS